MTLLQLLSDTLFMDEKDIFHFSATAPHRYKKYEINKRNGNGKRLIAHPSKELKFIQRLIITHLQELLPIHETALAYRKGKSIKDNAQIHLHTRYLLKMDCKDFFPSINPKLFFEVSQNAGILFNDKDKKLLSNILFYKLNRNSSLQLSIGAPSSPLISNFIMYFFDEEIKKVCDRKKINYTRYADDLTFSTSLQNILFEIPEIVLSSLENHTNGCIRINNQKTVFSSKAHNRHVTGITLSNNNTLSIGRKRKRQISSLIHKFTLGVLNHRTILHLQGLLSFAKYIEPDFYQRMCKKYGQESLLELMRHKP